MRIHALAICIPPWIKPQLRSRFAHGAGSPVKFTEKYQLHSALHRGVYPRPHLVNTEEKKNGTPIPLILRNGVKISGKTHRMCVLGLVSMDADLSRPIRNFYGVKFSRTATWMWLLEQRSSSCRGQDDGCSF